MLARMSSRWPDLANQATEVPGRPVLATPSDGRHAGPGLRLEARGLTRTLGSGRRILSAVDLVVQPGELVAVVGGSGAGKSTLLEALAGLAPPDRGSVRLGGYDLYENLERFRPLLGYVPQEDIIHLDLSLARTLHYTAALRMPGATTSVGVTEAVDTVLDALDLGGHRDTRVGALSGGQRKRASIAVELLTWPRMFFLDEPTSGLDPATSAALLRILRRLADAGTTVVFTTHAIQDLPPCDRVAFLATGGELAYVGNVTAALQHFGVDRIEDIYERLQPGNAAIGADDPEPRADDVLTIDDLVPKRRGVGAVRQLGLLTARTAETMLRNKLTLAILLGSPAMIVALFVILFRPGAFEFTDPQPTAILMILFWITFGAFFFGLTYGLLQIVVELPILRREHSAGLRLAPYLGSKVAVMLPFLAVVNVSMLIVLRLLDRLPPRDLATYASLAMTLTLTSLAALALGLLASAAVNNASQATLTLPMLCFPAVLFSGAILPVEIMATAGRWIAAVVPSRWAFEAVGHDLGIRRLMAEGGSALGPPLLETFGDAGTEPTGVYWAALASFTLIFSAAALVVLRRTGGRDPR